MAEEKIEFIAASEEEGSRLDAFLSGKLSEYSRSFLQKNIKNGCVQVNDKPSMQAIRS